MTSTKSDAQIVDGATDADLWDIQVVRRFFGGTRPLHAATVYRNVKAGRIPKPIKTGPGSARWLSAECRAAREAMMAERDTVGRAPVTPNENYL